ncbi:MAG: tRNA (adenosine(37)-N6)-threonylcarbamoyltransferase complex dimerization subunit type 1 TsaB [Deltaproteobacteria bacterium]|nr:tRNA (adenosine(37)-N6)-threonylcarbamoyltransferase complex dimerization subunit type 1 TsaB [Deltaproteobacteria bacterium]
MLVLAYDTSTLMGALGWISAQSEAPVERVESFAESAMPASPGHAETLLGRIDALLATGGHRVDQVELVVYGRGPGTFTGLRIGLSTAKGLALARGVPLIGLSSLECLALSAGVDGLVAPVIDALRGEIFTGLYEISHAAGRPRARRVADDRVVKPSEFGRTLDGSDVERPPLLVGNGVERYREELASHGVLGPTRSSAVSAYWMAVVGLERFLERGGDDPLTVEPIYLREPDARLPQQK